MDEYMVFTCYADKRDLFKAIGIIGTPRFTDHKEFPNYEEAKEYAQRCEDEFRNKSVPEFKINIYHLVDKMKV